jgi:folate-binding protein YgfZ
MPNIAPADITFCRLTQYGLLSVSSADNLKFLQGQFSCDVREVSERQWRYGALCTSKGRMIGNFLLAAPIASQHILRLPTSTLDAVSATLKKFAPFYKGTLTTITTDYSLVGLAGKSCAEFIRNVFTAVPTDTYGIAVMDDAVIIRLDAQRYECWIKQSAFPAYLEKLQTSATEQAESVWDLSNIRNGLGEVRGSTIEEWTPHMLNLQAIGAVNFKKGCYTGQEIVARTEYRGQQKRAMFRIKGRRLQGSGLAPEAGTEILDGEQKAGEIVMASATDNGDWEALAVINDQHLDKPLHCQQGVIQLLDLPYTTNKKA